MVNDRPESDLCMTWQEQTVMARPVDINDLVERARAFQRKIRWRNRVEYAAVLIGAAAYLGYIWLLENPWIRVGSLLFVLGGLSVIYQFHRRASSKTVPAGANCAEFHRRELQRQRDALRSIMRWYVGPLIPGAIVFNIGIATNHPWGPLLILSIAAVLWGGTTLLVYKLNQWGARKFQREIDDLSELLHDR